MAYQQSDLDKIERALIDGVKSVTFADGRKVERHSADEMRRLRADVKAELAASASQTRPRNRFIVGRIGSSR